METVVIKGEKRSIEGKSAIKALRNEGLVPCVLYSKDESTHFTAPEGAFRSLIYTPAFKLAEIEIDGVTHRCILKDIQFHPVTERILHVDFLKLIDGHPVKVNLPVRFVGSSPGVKLGGKLIQQIRKVKCKMIPAKLVDHLTVDISKLELGQSIRVKEIDALEGIQIMNPENAPIALVEIPRALRSAADAKAKEAAK